MKTEKLKMTVGMKGVGLISVLVLLLAGACSPPNLIHADPRDFLLQERDLPGEEAYFIPMHERHPIPNEMIVYLMGEKAGQERIQKTGRLLGWRVHFVRDESVDSGPEDITQVVMQFSSPQGARLNLEEYSLSRANPQEWQRLDAGLVLGEASLAETRVVTFADGSTMVYYALNFTQNNLGVRIDLNGMAGKVSLKDALDLAIIVLAKLGQAELSRSPVPTPTPGFDTPEEGIPIYR